MSKCVTAEARASAVATCKRNGIASPACITARMRLCPPPDVQPVIEQGKDGINLLGPWQYRGCEVTPPLAPYPPSRPLPNEAMSQAALDRLTASAQKQSKDLLTLRSRAARERKLELGIGFWAGLGLCAIGGAALFVRR